MPFYLRVTRICYYVTLSACLTVGTAFAGAQRMGIAAGTYDLAPQGTSSLRAFCFDLTRDSPTSSTDYTQVLTPTADATVTIGTQTLSLQDAITKHLITIQGMDADVEDMVARSQYDPEFLSNLLQVIPPQKQADYKEGVANWRNFTAPQKSAFDAAFAPILGPLGDHTKIKFVNNTNRSMQISFTQNALFDTVPESIQGLPLTEIGNASAHLSQDQIQANIWKKAIEASQTKLQTVGYYDGPIDGDLGDKTIAAIIEFQVSNYLPVNGQLDAATAQKLDERINDLSTLSQINKISSLMVIDQNQNIPFLAGLIQYIALPNGHGFYLVSLGSGQTFSEDDISGVYGKLSEIAAGGGIPRIYLVPDSHFSVDQRTGLMASFRQAARGKKSDNRIRIVDSETGRIAGNPFLDKSVTGLKDDGGEPQAVSFTDANGVSQSGYQYAVDLTLSNGSTEKLTIFGRTAAIITAFLQNLNDIITAFLGSAIAQQNFGQLSPAELVNLAASQARKDNHLATDDLQVKFGYEFVEISIVGAPNRG